MSDLTEIKGVLEAALLVAGEPVPATQLACLFEPALDPETVRKLLDELRADWDGRKVALVQVASGWRFQGRPEVQPYLDRLTPEKPPRYLKPPLFCVNEPRITFAGYISDMSRLDCRPYGSLTGRVAAACCTVS